MPLHAVAPAPSEPSLASPLTAAYARLTEVFPSLRVREVPRGGTPESGAGWVRATCLAEGGATFENFLAWDEEQARRDYGQEPRPDVVASFALHRYAWPVCLLVTMPWFLHRRVPRIPVEAVSFQRTLGELSVRVEEFACLPGDPAAREPGARVVADEEALRAEVRAAVAEHLTPVLEAFRPRMRRGSRALWGMATDEITEGLWYLGHLLGEEERAMREAGVLLPGGTTPYAQSAGFRQLTGTKGESLTTRDRASCCLYYTLRPEDTCVTCPRTCDAERIARLSPDR
ncbi:FhuF 2Fe-2S C-terminal domain-containing protein [Streptomyces sp. WMMB 714]|uniref:(2Fe-2S)-binding protein n=1 Tax=Streptomyces sp. WMMB 714 TaxID=1286822 RepID=UPI0005F79366|nr:(2Fe-2S)-binding protein [Streptomyces sp. WMMB 714]SCK43634.1 FhuF 2Fe-2S C-terminal domain-containing protein [Streptomyces sp. WMMB 714]